jgi:hypothetical protein
MILPTKHLELDKSLLAIGGRILNTLPRPRTVTSMWEEVRKHENGLTFESFALALAFLYTIGAVEMKDELIRSARR